MLGAVLNRRAFGATPAEARRALGTVVIQCLGPRRRLDMDQVWTPAESAGDAGCRRSLSLALGR
jgi:hypothetical protein